MARVYPVLRRIAARRLGGGSVTLSPTELANEAYLELREQRDATFANRNHFFAIAAHVIRRLVVDHLRERNAQKRGGGVVHVTLEAHSDLPAESNDGVDALAIDRLLENLERVDRRAAQLVELRYFAGLTIEEPSELTGVAPVTVRREERRARTWLHSAMSGGGRDEG